MQMMITPFSTTSTIINLFSLELLSDKTIHFTLLSLLQTALSMIKEIDKMKTNLLVNKQYTL